MYGVGRVGRHSLIKVLSAFYVRCHGQWKRTLRVLLPSLAVAKDVAASLPKHELAIPEHETLTRMFDGMNFERSTLAPKKKVVFARKAESNS